MQSELRVSTIRSTSLGIKGTYRNANHHAKKLIPLVDALSREVFTWGFSEWKQAHNIHIFTTKDDREFCFRPFREPGEGYVGLRLFYRKSRSKTYPLVSIYHDSRNGVSIEDLAKLMPAFASPVIEEGDEDSGDEQPAPGITAYAQILEDARASLNRVEYAIFKHLVDIVRVSQAGQTTSYRAVGEALSLPYAGDALGKHLGPISEYTYAKYGFMLSVLVRYSGATMQTPTFADLGGGFFTLAETLLAKDKLKPGNDFVQSQIDKIYAWASSLSR